ncbi:MAG: TIGR03936 family radical SAM-associated protein [Clostridiales bacterium]|nr:TIGR03936 family radical SAM-associated protein [Clostridiales bacterium]
MKVRIKFSKTGAMKFIGHLDTMRFFQKAIRRADIPVAYSEGFSPHMIMSFAAPLGVGTTSSGEYFDMQLAKDMPTKELVRRMNTAMVEGIEVLSAVRVEDGKASKAMSLVAAADYEVTFREGREFVPDWESKLEEYLRQPELPVFKKTKRSEKTVDIKPFIYQYQIQKNKLFLKLAAASSNYTKPEQVMDGFAQWLGVEQKPFAYIVHRLEVYADNGNEQKHEFVTLESLGEEVE